MASRKPWRSIPPRAVFVECPDCFVPVVLTSKDQHRSAVHPSSPCCDLHRGGVTYRLGQRVAACCDPDDCGPCCEQCPTCPTLNRARTVQIIPLESKPAGEVRSHRLQLPSWRSREASET